MRRTTLCSPAHFTVFVLIAITLTVLCLIRVDAVCKLQADTLLELQAHRERMEYVEPAAVEPEPVSLGEFKIYHYCACKACCGKTNGITATGTVATPGRTVAVDPNVIPLGSVVVIDGHKYIAEDTGGAIKGKKIDMFCESHEEALQRGVAVKEVFVIGNTN